MGPSYRRSRDRRAGEGQRPDRGWPLKAASGRLGQIPALAGFRQAVQPSSTEGRGIVFTLFCVSVEGVKEGPF